MTLQEQVSHTVAGYRKHGAGHWPGAHHFELVELDQNGRTGEYRYVCHGCSTTAARFVLEVLLQDRNPLWDMVGAYASPAEHCYFCGGKL
jgi:20S proteasome alpha/beta subunit